MRAASRPDPSKGVFETMLVLDGGPVELAAHLERLGASVDLLFDLRLPRSLEESILDSSRGMGHGRLRVSLAPGGDGRAKTSISTAEIEPAVLFPPPEQGTALSSLVVAGGLGAHKWVDRMLLERAGVKAPRVPLLLDGDGTLLEAAKGNVFVVEAGRLRTPPTDGRILPGVTRRRAIEVALELGLEVWEEELVLDDLFAAEEVFSTGSVGGIEPVRSVDGIELVHRGEVSARIGADLWRLWSTASERAADPALAASQPPGPPAR